MQQRGLFSHFCAQNLLKTPKPQRIQRNQRKLLFSLLTTTTNKTCRLKFSRFSVTILRSSLLLKICFFFIFLCLFFISFSSNLSHVVQVPYDRLDGRSVSLLKWSSINDLFSLGETQQVARLLWRQGEPVRSFYLPSEHLRKLLHASAPFGKGVV